MAATHHSAELIGEIPQPIQDQLVVQISMVLRAKIHANFDRSMWKAAFSAP